MGFKIVNPGASMAFRTHVVGLDFTGFSIAKSKKSTLRGLVLYLIAGIHTNHVVAPARNLKYGFVRWTEKIAKHKYNAPLMQQIIHVLKRVFNFCSFSRRASRQNFTDDTQDVLFAFGRR